MTGHAQPIVTAVGVSKWYRARLRRDWLLARPFARRHGESQRAGHWALRDVSFELERGRSLGIVGNNGAGKTTLMRILAGISRSTEGRVSVRGRVASRFGYGVAFNPYLSGRENIFLEGTLLGMTNRQIRVRLDEILDVAALDGAIDRPLWTYSSGMTSRLGFSIAALVDSDVLLLDEALSAGDGTFRQRGEQLLLDAREQGRSLIVVSHGLSLVRKLCDDGLWIDHGAVGGVGPVDEVVDAYEQSAALPSSRPKDVPDSASLEGDSG